MRSAQHEYRAFAGPRPCDRCADPRRARQARSGRTRVAQPPAGAACARGLTLIELLAVTMILAISASVLMTRLCAVVGSTSTRSAAARLLDLDARARVLARTGVACVIAIDDETHSASMRTLGDGSVCLTVALPLAVDAQLINEQSGSAAAPFDALGRSDDYLLRLESREGTSTWRVLGLTGRAVQLEGAP